MKHIPHLLIMSLFLGLTGIASAQNITVTVQTGDLLPSLTESNAQLISFGSPSFNEVEGIAFQGWVRQTNWVTNTVTRTNLTVTRVATNAITKTNSYTIGGITYPYTNTVVQYGYVTNTNVTTTNRVTRTVTTWSGMWADDSQGRRNMVTCSDSPAPGTDGSFVSFSDPCYNNSNAVAFIGRASIPAGATNPVANTNSTSKMVTGIWTTQPFGGFTSLTPVAFLGAPAPGTTCKFTQFFQIALPDQGGVLINGSAGSTQGIWAQDSTGTLKLIVKRGGTVAVNGTNKVISSFSFLDPTYESIEGQTRCFSQNTGNLIFNAWFTDGQQAILKVTFP